MPVDIARASVEREQGANACWRLSQEIPGRCCAWTGPHCPPCLHQRRNCPLFFTPTKELPTFLSPSTHDLIFTSAKPSAPFSPSFLLSPTGHPPTQCSTSITGVPVCIIQCIWPRRGYGIRPWSADDSLWSVNASSPLLGNKVPEVSKSSLDKHSLC